MQKQRGPVSNCSGFTLVEVLVALVITLILVMAFVPMFELVAKTVSSNKHREVATSLANSMIEEMRSLPFIVMDPDTGMLETDPSVKQLGIQNGNPPGSIPAEQTRTVDGVTYTIRTNISWVQQGSNPTASKKVSVTIEAPSVFKNGVTVTSEVHTLASEEGELNLPKSGHIRVRIKDKDGNILESPDIEVSIDAQSGSVSQTNYTDDGETLFGVIAAGYYTVSAVLPGGMAYQPEQALINGSLEMGDVEVTDLNITEVEFFIDQPGKINLSLIDADSSEAITGSGECVLDWTEDGSTHYQSIATFDEDDFVNDHLASGTIGDLWPGGHYSMLLNGVLDSSTLKVYADYDMSAADADPPQLDGDDWDGAFDDAGTTLDLVVELDSLLETRLTTSIENQVTGTETPDPDDPSHTVLLVDQWNDQSSNGFTALAVDGNKPLLYNNVLNGYPVIRFRGAERLRISNPAVPADNFTLIVVAKADVTHEIDIQSNSSIEGVWNQKYLFWPDHGGDANAGQGLSLGTNGVTNYEHGSGYMPPNAVYAGDLRNFSVIGVNYLDKQPFLYINGSETQEGLASLRSKVFAPTIIGGGGYGYFSGDIAEILIYDASLSSENIELISNYLIDKYNL